MPATTASRITQDGAGFRAAMVDDLRWNAAENVRQHAECLAGALVCTKPVARVYLETRAAGFRRRAGRCLDAARILDAGGTVDAARALAEGATFARAWVYGRAAA